VAGDEQFCAVPARAFSFLLVEQWCFYPILHYAIMPKEIPKEISPELYEVYDYPTRMIWLQRLML